MTDNDLNENSNHSTGEYSAPDDYSGQYHERNGYTSGEGTNTGGSTPGGYSYGYNGNYGNNGNYGYNVQPPRDKKGRLIHNRFGMKLTFAIIEMVFSLALVWQGGWCVGVAPLVLSVIATVFVCQQNTEYKAQNWGMFVSRNKASNVLLWISFGILMAYVLLVIILAILILLGVFSMTDILRNSGVDLEKLNDIYENRADYDRSVDDLDDDVKDLLDDLDSQLDDDDDHDNDDDDYRKDDHSDRSHAGGGIENTNGEYAADVEGFESFTLSGKKISLPVSCGDFRAAGFTFGKEADEKLEAGESSGFPYYDAEGGHRGTVFIYNTTEKKIKAKNGIIGGITIEDDNAKGDLEFVGGLGFASSLDDCAQVLGSKVTEEEVGDDYNSCSWWFEKGGYYTSIQLEFDEDDCVRRVWIMNTLGLN